MQKFVRTALFGFLVFAGCTVLCAGAANLSTPTPIAGQIAIEKYKADRAEASQKQQARDALSQTIVDKGFLAIIVAFVGFIISRALDRYQSQLAADSEIESKRFDHMDEVWTLLHQCEHIKQEVGSLVRRGARWQKTLDLISDYDDGFQERAAAARRKVDETSHWLGPQIHRELIEYHNTLVDLFRAYTVVDLARATRLETELQRRRRYIADPRRLSFNRWGIRIS